MRSDKYLNDILTAISPSKSDIIYEIGPGEGALTSLLVGSGAKVKSIEIDSSLYPVLESKFQGFPNWELIKQDILQIDFNSLYSELDNSKRRIIVGNLPYNISKPIIRKFLESDTFSQGIFLIQKEVADDYTAHEGYETFLHISSSVYAESKYLFTVPSKYFYPVPKVDGGLISFDKMKAEKLYLKIDKLQFIKFVKSAFSNPRKTFMNSLKSYLKLENIELNVLTEILATLNLKPNIRPHEILLNDWYKIFELLQK